MKKIFTTLSVLMLFIAAARSQSEDIKGDYYIKLIDVHNIFDNMPEDLIEKTNKNISDPNSENEHSDSEKKIVDYYVFLSKNNLLQKPHFKLKTSEGKIINVFTTDKEYQKIKTKLQNFDKYEEHFVIDFAGVKKSDGFFDEPIYYTDKIISVVKILGESDWKK